VRTELLECERAARADGLAAGLGRALAGTDVAGAAPGPYAAVPAGLVAEGDEVRGHRLADLEGIVFVARPEGRLFDKEACADAGRRLAAARLGLARRLLDAAVDHLSGRTGGGEPLIRKQLVMGTIADAVTEIELLRQYVLTLHGGAALADAHARLDAVGWEIARLFGASGYIADNETRALYVSALVANTWIDGEQRNDRV